MDPNEKLVKDIVDQVKSGMLTAEQVDTMLTEKTKDMLKADALKEIDDAVKAQGIELKKMQEAGPKQIKTIGEILRENHEAIKTAIKQKAHMEMQFKTAVLRSSISSAYQGYQLPDIGQKAYAGTPLSSLFRKVTGLFPDGIIRYTDQNTVTRNSTTIAEQGTYPESVLNWITRTLTIEKIGDTIPVSEEALADLDFVEGEIRRLLEVGIALKEEQQLLAGTGTTPELKVAYVSASTFDSAAYTGYKPVSANIFDLARVLAVEIMNGKESKYRVTHIIVNPSDVLQMDLNKDDEGRYLIPPFAVITPSGEVTIKGVKVIECPTLTANTCLVGDFNQGTIYEREGFTAELGYGDGQFITDMMTLKVRKREALLIRNIDAGAFLKSTDIATDLANITSATS
jgi:HK97 family phage major capsid protein